MRLWARTDTHVCIVLTVYPAGDMSPPDTADRDAAPNPSTEEHTQGDPVLDPHTPRETAWGLTRRWPDYGMSPDAAAVTAALLDLADAVRSGARTVARAIDSHGKRKGR